MSAWARRHVRENGGPMMFQTARVCCAMVAAGVRWPCRWGSRRARWLLESGRCTAA